MWIDAILYRIIKRKSIGISSFLEAQYKFYSRKYIVAIKPPPNNPPNDIHINELRKRKRIENVGIVCVRRCDSMHHREKH